MDFIRIPLPLSNALRRLTLNELGCLFLSLMNYNEGKADSHKSSESVTFAFEILKAEIDAGNPDHSSFSTEGINIRPAYFPYPFSEIPPELQNTPHIYNSSLYSNLSIPDKENIEDQKNNVNQKGVQGGKQKRFIPPSLDEVRAYIAERKSPVNPDAFWNFYESKDWMIGKNKMKNWHAAISTWERNDTNGANRRYEVGNPQSVAYTPLPGETFL